MEQELYIKLLRKELVEAKGCTEPLAIAYLSSVARSFLEEDPVEAILYCSSNIIKNARCAMVPGCEGFYGVYASCALGIFGGDSKLGFDCISKITDKEKKLAQEFVNNKKIKLENLKTNCKLHLEIDLKGSKDNIFVEIKDYHLNVVKIKKNSNIIYENKKYKDNNNLDNYSGILTFNKIYEFIESIDIEKVVSILEPQYKHNLEIAKYSIDHPNFGLNIGKIILNNDKSVFGKIKAYTSSASEARMCGCNMSVVINSGSGNQGLSSSLPVIIYAMENNIDTEKMYRALLLANLLTIAQKNKIGSLSAFCGVVSSCGSSGAAITYLAGGSKEQVIKTLKNHLATVPGIICDGAKASCAAKIAASLDSAIMAHHLAMNNLCYANDEGILKDNVDETISIVSNIGRDGMSKTDEEIMKVLVK
ncbi:MAG: L-serine ammonia-lyase, iron-sulfur-dependent, subunit alpha [Bacilli bacterium]|nr:L-serine ammonia-lyase, iron-sulfur-dependent, subunit alpha [Bacilli bacterium]MDD4584386.1 L-serine ammonia-lyase, iron-sulfur-dependent, subunit alpha [Bacilli bacterium]